MIITDQTTNAVAKYLESAGQLAKLDENARAVSAHLQDYESKATQLTADAYQITKADIPAINRAIVEALTEGQDVAKLREKVSQAKRRADTLSEEASEAGLVVESLRAKLKDIQSERGAIMRERVQHLKAAYSSYHTANPVTEATTLSELRLLYAATTDSQKMVQANHTFAQFVGKLAGSAQWESSRKQLHELMGLSR